MVNVGIVGGTGYTGIELLRLLARHEKVNLTKITSRGSLGTKVADYYPSLRGCFADLEFTEPGVDELSDCEIVFFATPNGIAMKMVPDLIERGIRVIDLAADFRIKDVNVWQQWYQMEHACPDYIEQAVYGLPEVYREQIKDARLIANPGCYPTAVQLGLMPLLRENVIDTTRIIADVKSGVSGAGRNPQTRTLICEASENFQAYAIGGHRHQVEISQELEFLSGVKPGLTFLPHLVPMTRGILATLYLEKVQQNTDLQTLFETAYAQEPFVDVLPQGGQPETKSVRGTNLCRIAVHERPQTNQIIVISVIDNLVKGASGQAVHNMNLMLGFKETEGLEGLALIV